MKSASIHDIKQELSSLPPKKVIDLCLRLARFKKDNKDLLTYLLFEAHNEQGYVESVKLEMEEQFALLPTSNWYNTKKGLRKILRGINKYVKHTATKESEVEMRLYFCQLLSKSGLPIRRQKALASINDMQVKKLSLLVGQVHEDLRFDYKRQLDQLTQAEHDVPFLEKVVNRIRGK